MSSTQLIAPSSPLRGPASDDPPEELASLIGVVPTAGPPIILVAGPLVLFPLLLAGPALFLLTLAVLLVACAACAALAGTIVASRYLLFRHLRAHGLPRAHRTRPAARFVPVGSRRWPA
jgi:hypothetical protein